MEDVHECCPNAPYFEDEWDEVLIGSYNFNMCKLNFDNWPDNFLPGYYQLVIESFDEEGGEISRSNVIIEIELRD